jgi:hypothetical protein
LAVTARCFLSPGELVAAQQILEEIYGWFTEGFDTVDLKEVKALLKALT